MVRPTSLIKSTNGMTYYPSLSLILANPSPETDRQAREETGNRQETPTGLQREAARKIGERI